MTAKDKINNLLTEIPQNVKLVAVSKTMPVSTIHEFYSAGHKIFGENKVQEIMAKHPELPDDIEWHFIGHLQRNKVKYIIPFVALIHGVDSLKLLQEINKQAEKVSRKIGCLLQFHIATEESKFGFDLKEAQVLLESKEYAELKNININGVMGMATYTDDQKLVRSEFRSLHSIFQELKRSYFNDSVAYKDISMGMSGDYKIAIEEGSTIIRIGSKLFGSRY